MRSFLGQEVTRGVPRTQGVTSVPSTSQPRTRAKRLPHGYEVPPMLPPWVPDVITRYLLHNSVYHTFYAHATCYTCTSCITSCMHNIMCTTCTCRFTCTCMQERKSHGNDASVTHCRCCDRENNEPKEDRDGRWHLAASRGWHGRECQPCDYHAMP